MATVFHPAATRVTRALCAAACLCACLAAAAQPISVAPAAMADATPVAIARLTQLEDRELRDARGTRAGEFEDVVFDLQSGRILHAVVSVDRGSGEGEAELAVPLRDLGVFRPGAGDRPEPRLVIAVSPRTLPPASKPVEGSPYASGEGLLDDPIRDAAGESVAEVKDVLIDFRSASVRHLLVQANRAVGRRDHLLIVGLSRLRRPDGSRHLVFDGSAEQLAAMPSVPRAKLDTTDFASTP